MLPLLKYRIQRLSYDKWHRSEPWHEFSTAVFNYMPYNTTHIKLINDTYTSKYWKPRHVVGRVRMEYLCGRLAYLKGLHDARLGAISWDSLADTPEAREYRKWYTEEWSPDYHETLEIIRNRLVQACLNYENGTQEFHRNGDIKLQPIPRKRRR